MTRVSKGLLTGVLILAAAIATVAVFHVTVFHWLWVHTGVRGAKGSDPWSNWWGGPGSDIGEITLVAAAYTGIGAFYVRHNCHEQSCRRLGNYQVPGTAYVVCKKHHQEIHGLAPDEGITVEHMRRAHEQAMGRTHPVQSAPVQSGHPGTVPDGAVPATPGPR